MSRGVTEATRRWREMGREVRENERRESKKMGVVSERDRAGTEQGQEQGQGERDGAGERKGRERTGM